MPPRKKAARRSAPEEAHEEGNVNAVQEETVTQPQESTAGDEAGGDEAESAPAADEASEGVSLTMEERKAKLAALRKKKSESATLNRAALITDQNTRRASAKELARLERKKRQAESLGEKEDAREQAGDGDYRDVLERKRAWDWTIEQNEEWERKRARKERRGDADFVDYTDATRRKYKKDIDALRPDLAKYNEQREAAMASVAADIGGGQVVAAGSSTGEVIRSRAEEMLYRDANSFVYADHKPTEEAIDRVIGQINSDIDKRNHRSRKRREDDGDVTYINDRNKVFNKKIARFYDKYTQETRDNLERGTAI